MKDHPPKELSNDDITALRKLSERYVQIKVIIAYTEEIQIDHKADIMVYKELRDCLDHTMRFLFSRLSSNSLTIDSPDEYRDINLGKSIGHAYRAAFDALDVTTLSLKEHIRNNLKEYSGDTSAAVIPNYYELKIKLNELSTRAAERRGKKDIGNITDSVFDGYVQDVDELKKLHDAVLNAGPELDEHKRQLFWEKWKFKIWGISLVVLGSLGTFIVKWAYDKFGSSL